MGQNNTQESADRAATQRGNRGRELDEVRSKRVVKLAKHIREITTDLSTFPTAQALYSFHPS
jgi:hypothetical protein